MMRSCVLWVLAVLVIVQSVSFFAHAQQECEVSMEGECIAVESDTAAAATTPDSEPVEPVQEEAEEEIATETVETVQETVTEAAEEKEAPVQEATTDEVEPPNEEEPVVTDEVIEEPEQVVEPIEEETPAEEEAHDNTDEGVATSDEPVVEEKSEEPVVEEEKPAEKVKPVAKDTPAEEENTPGCPSRKHIIKCCGEYLDTDKNGYLERSELQAAIDGLPWLSRGIISILGSVDKMMKKCDYDKDDAIGMDYDMAHNGATCLASCFKRKAFKSAFFPQCEA